MLLTIRKPAAAIVTDPPSTVMRFFLVFVGALNDALTFRVELQGLPSSSYNQTFVPRQP